MQFLYRCTILSQLYQVQIIFRGGRTLMSQNHHLRQKEAIQSVDGFTLIEMMVAVFVVSVMVSILMPHLLGAGQRAEATATDQTERTIRSSLEEYYLIHHSMPQGNTAAQLNALVADQLLESIPTSPAIGNYLINDGDVNNVSVTVDTSGITNQS